LRNLSFLCKRSLSRTRTHTNACTHSQTWALAHTLTYTHTRKHTHTHPHTSALTHVPFKRVARKRTLWTHGAPWNVAPLRCYQHDAQGVHARPYIHAKRPLYVKRNLHKRKKILPVWCICIGANIRMPLYYICTCILCCDVSCKSAKLFVRYKLAECMPFHTCGPDRDMGWGSKKVWEARLVRKSLMMAQIIGLSCNI